MSTARAALPNTAASEGARWGGGGGRFGPGAMPGYFNDPFYYGGMRQAWQMRNFQGPSIPDESRMETAADRRFAMMN
eukprot:gene9356-9519_t